jgi:hypothetical protein
MQRKKKQAPKKVAKRRPTGRQSQSQGKGASSNGRSGPTKGVASVPSSVGMILPRSSFQRGGRAQAMADQDSGSSERITGCDLYSLPIKSGSSTPAAGFGGTAAYWSAITPSIISTRLGAIEEMYQWYAFRRIKFHYVPNTGTGTVGSVALGVTTDWEESVSFATPTQQQTLEFNPSVLTPVWAMATMELQHKGSKLFECYAANGESEDTRYQAQICAVILGGVASTVYGQLWIEYELDFYQQSPLLSSVDFFRSETPCTRCGQFVRTEPRPKHLLFAEKFEKAVHSRSKRFEQLEHKQRDRDDEFVVLRTQEPQQGFPGLPTYQGLESTSLRREESKAHTTTRLVSSLKG